MQEIITDMSTLQVPADRTGNYQLLRAKKPKEWRILETKQGCHSLSARKSANFELPKWQKPEMIALRKNWLMCILRLYRAVSPICLRLGNADIHVQALQTISPNAEFIEPLYKMQNEVSYLNIRQNSLKQVSKDAEFCFLHEGNKFEFKI